MDPKVQFLTIKFVQCFLNRGLISFLNMCGTADFQTYLFSPTLRIENENENNATDQIHQGMAFIAE